MILIKGRRVWCEMRDGREIYCPASFGMMHDPEGEHWPACVLLIGPYRRSRRSVDLSNAAKDYFGPDYDGHEASIDVPQGAWKSLGEVSEIFYERTGLTHPGDYRHAFRKDSHVILSKSGRFFRLELPKGCVVNWRGFVNP